MWNQRLESGLHMYASVKSDDVDVPDDWEDLEGLTGEEREALVVVAGGGDLTGGTAAGQWPGIFT
jgi:hypothetical protein